MSQKDYKSDVLDLMKAIAKEESPTSGYNEQRKMIQGIFAASQDVQCRLVVVDSLYATNGNRSYFVFDDMAAAINSIGNEEQVRQYFRSIAREEKKEETLFDQTFGLHKDAETSDQHISLLSKYAYYALVMDSAHDALGFPIYDKLVREIYPRAAKLLGIKKVRSKASMKNIYGHVEALNELRRQLFGDSKELFNGWQQYDLLDAYLWRMGKLDGGNLSLVLSKEDYIKFIHNIGAYDNDELQVRLADDKNYPTPFAGCGNETYMQKLLTHWRTYLCDPTKQTKTKKQLS